MTQDKNCGCSTTQPHSAGLTLAQLKAALAIAPQLPLTILWTDGEPIEAHFHITEIGRVQKDFVDCGGTVRQRVTCLLQTWVGNDTDHRITAEKLLKAFAHSEQIFRGEDLPVELEYEACNVVQLIVASLQQEPDRFVIQLTQKHTDCLAKELCLPSSKTSGTSCG